MKKRIWCMFMAFLMLFACVGMADSAAPEASVYRTLYSGEVTTLNYLITATTNEFAVAANVIDTLIECDVYGQIQPALAKNWETSEDGLVWTFHLRDDATWVDAACNVVAKVTANDFVAAAKYILNAQNASGTAKNLYSYIAGAEEYYLGTATPAEGKEPAPVMAWDTVGVKALDDFTLQYTLKAPVPYFLSMVDYVCFMPVYEPFLLEKGADFGLATGNDTILYCGAYVLGDFKPQERRVYVKNIANWDAANVTIDTIEQKFNKEASTIAPELLIRGEVDSASIETAVATEWLGDPAKADLIRPVRQSGMYSYFYCFNFDPQFDAAYEPANWKLVVANENFRKSIYAGLDRVKAMLVTDPDNAESMVYNAITPPNFVLQDGVDYVNTGDLAAISAKGAATFDADAAIAYRDAAVTELTAAGATFPVKVLMPYNPGTGGWDEECQVVEQQLEALLGADYIDIIVEAGPSSGFLKAVRRSGMYALMKCNWGADYADPQTYSEPFAPENNYNFMDKLDAISDITGEYYELVAAACDIATDMPARYAAFAKAEAYMIDHALVIPFGYGTGGYTASRIDPFTQQFSPNGLSSERYKGSVLLDKPMSTDQYYDAYDQWLEARDALVQ